MPIALSQRTKLIGTIGEDIDVVDNGDRVLVGDPYPEGEAEAAGLVGGATLVAVNGEPVDVLDDVIDAAVASNAGVVVLTTEDDAARPRITASTWVPSSAPPSQRRSSASGRQAVLIHRVGSRAVVGCGRDLRRDRRRSASSASASSSGRRT